MMNIKTLLILAIITAAAYYAIAVKNINPFSEKIKDDLPFRKFDGEVTSMKDLAGENGTLIVHLGTWCPHCREQLINIYPLDEGLKEFKINVVLIVSGTNNDEIHDWAYQYQVPGNWKKVYWHDGLTEGLKIKKDAVPYIILRDRNGKIVHNQSGVHSINNLMDITGAMLESYDEFKEKMKEPIHPL